MGVNLIATARDQGEFLAIATILGPASLGYWTVATRIQAVLVELGVSVVSSVATPAFALMNSDRIRLARAYKRVTSASAMVILPMLAILGTLSADLVPRVFGSQWAESGHISTVLSVMALFAVLVNFDKSVYLATGRPGVELALVLIVVVLHLVTVVAFTHWGLMALAIAVLVRAVLTWPIRVLVLRRVAGMTWNAYTGVALAFVSAGVATAVMVALRMSLLPGSSSGHLVSVAIVGATTYSAVMCFISQEFRDLASAIIALIAPRVLGQRATRMDPEASN